MPGLLTPLASGKRPSGGQQSALGAWFPELTVPTSMMVSVLAFGASSPKRNKIFRARSAAVLVDLLRLCCRTGNFKVTTRPCGLLVGPPAVQWPVPRDGCLPLPCFVSTTAGQQEFANAWAWDLKDIYFIIQNSFGVGHDRNCYVIGQFWHLFSSLRLTSQDLSKSTYLQLSKAGSPGIGEFIAVALDPSLC